MTQVNLNTGEVRDDSTPFEIARSVHEVIARMRATDPEDDYDADDVASLIGQAERLADLIDQSQQKN